jgi:hypothetical protein
VASWLRLSRREEAWKTAEILILRHQLAVLQRRAATPPERELGGLGIRPVLRHRFAILQRRQRAALV